MMSMTMGDMVDIVVLVVLYFAVFYQKWRVKSRDILLVNTLLYIYLGFVLYFTLMPIVTSLPFIFNHQYVPMNFAPFVDVAAGRGDYARQVILNVVMTVSFGILLPLTERHPKFWRTVGWTLLLSLAIELVQPLISNLRTSDITDVITNVLGGAIGYGVYVVLKPMIDKVLDRISRRVKSKNDIIK